MMAKIKKSIRYTMGDRIFLTIDFVILVLLLIAIAYPLIYIFFTEIHWSIRQWERSLIYL